MKKLIFFALLTAYEEILSKVDKRGSGVTHYLQPLYNAALHVQLNSISSTHLEGGPPTKVPPKVRAITAPPKELIK